MVAILLDSVVYVPSLREIDEHGVGLQPAVFNHTGQQLIAIFSGLDRAKVISEIAPFCISMTGLQLIERVPTGFGLVINPKFDLGLEIPADGVRNIRHDINVEGGRA